MPDRDPVQSRISRWLADFSGPQTVALFGAFTLIALFPILAHPLPPLEDYPNHLARAYVISTIHNDPELARFYEIEWQIIPNLVMDLIVPLFHPVMNIYRAGQLFTVLTFVLMISGTASLNRALFGHWSIWPLAVLPLLYNRVFLVGLMNYMFGIGVALWGLAAWLWLRERPWPLRLAVSALFVVALFFSHLFAVGLYGLGLLAIELWRLWTKRDRPWLPRIVDFTATGLPFVLAIFLLLMGPTRSLSGQNDWGTEGKLDGLYLVIASYSNVVGIALAVLVAAAIAWAMSQRILRLHPIGGAIIAIGAVVYIAMPQLLFDTYMGDQRLPIALAFMAIACMQLDLRRRAVRAGFALMLGAVLLVRVAEVEANWASLASEISQFRHSLDNIKERGSRVLVAQGDPAAGDDMRDFGLAHAACLAIIERSALVATAFTISGKQVMHVRPPYQGQVVMRDGDLPTVEQLTAAAAPEPPAPTNEPPPYWQQWQSHFDYVYVLFPRKEDANFAPKLLTLIHDGGRFQLYKVKPPSADTSAPDRHVSGP